MSLDSIQAEIAEWTTKFHIDGNPDPLADALAICEEAGEVARAVLKRAHGQRPGTDWEAQLYDELGDLAITIMSLCANEGWSFGRLVADRWDEVKHR